MKVAESKPKKGVTQPGDMTIPALSEALGLSQTTIKNNVKHGCPRTVEGAKEWRLNNVNQMVADVSPEDVRQELRLAELAERTENARKRKIENDLKEGIQIPKEEVERDVALAFSRMASHAQGLGSQLANVVPSELKATVKETVEGAVIVWLKELADSLRVESE